MVQGTSRHLQCIQGKDRSPLPPPPQCSGGEDEDESKKESNLQYEEDPTCAYGDLHCGPHASTCGHVMHARCWQKFFESVVTKERRRPAR
ncbi:hypothetical protein HPB51_014073 [Rhipicephalus microplus]|uniref:Uncharacterized protein n=1 Tax=Rhipicephalus microplus TaxID=6941 RepID=A0A9J6EAZ8_RHIMP|nr:hypothetical protein HPB51_014073 [Rhipicephalus microplus]